MLRALLLSGVAVFLASFVACSKDPAPADTSTSSGFASSSSGTSNGGTSNGGTTSSTTSTGGTSGNPVPSADVVVSNETVDVDGVSRIYKLVVPKTYDAAKKYPLIIAMHGDDQNAEGFVTFSKLDVAAGKEAVMAFTDQSLDLETAFDDNPDQKMVPAIIEAVKGKRSIDAAKIWGFGYSKGAFQVGELLCRKKGIFNAVAVHAGGAPQERNAEGGVECPNADTVPMFVTQGANDGNIGSEFYAQSFAEIAGCDAFGARAKASPDICQKFNGCPNNLSMFYCVVPGQGHYPIYDNAAAHSLAWFKTL